MSTTMKKVFTTGQVAKICKVAPRTVSKWFDSGRLRGYRIPGSQDRRIPREHLIRFLKDHGMLAYAEELERDRWHKILIVGAEKLFLGRVRELLPEAGGYRVEFAGSGFEAGIQAESFHPDTMIIDLAMGRSEALAIVKRIFTDPAYEGVNIIGIASEDETATGALLKECYGFSEVYRKPFDVEVLAKFIAELAGQDQGRN